MKKNTFKLIVLLMSVSLLGLIGLQVVWIGNALKLQQQQFDNNVSTALNTLAQKIEDIENSTIIKNELFRYINDTVNEVEYERMITDTPQIRQDITIRKTPSKEILLQFDSLRLRDSLTDDVMIFSNINKTFDTNFKANKFNDNAIYLSSKKADNVKRTFIKVVEEITSGKPPINIRLKRVHFDSLLYTTLNATNLNTKYTAQIIEDDSVKWGTDTLLGGSKVYSSAIFPDDVVNTNATLNIQFPVSHIQLWLNVGWLLAGSLLFTLIIIITFRVSIKTLLKQKKISEIKSDFINNMTHEFKTPIATISLAVDSINTPQVLQNKEKLSYYSSVIKEENERMLYQVENILQISLLDKHELQLQTDQLNLHAILDKAIKNISLQVEKKQGTIIKNYQAHTPTVTADLFHLTNVFTNLLDNANKYSEKKPYIEVSTNNVNGSIEIHIKDNGIGMKEETLKRVFDKFYRAHTGDVHNVKGFGLGLSYAKAIITAHHGSITVKSTHSKGSEFIVTLPIDEHA